MTHPADYGFLPGPTYQTTADPHTLHTLTEVDAQLLRARRLWKNARTEGRTLAAANHLDLLDRLTDRRLELAKEMTA